MYQNTGCSIVPSLPIIKAGTVDFINLYAFCHPLFFLIAIFFHMKFKIEIYILLTSLATVMSANAKMSIFLATEPGNFLTF